MRRRWALASPQQGSVAPISGAADNHCDGTLAFDWNAYRTSSPMALGQPFAAVQHVVDRGWFSDSPAPKTTNLSDGLEFIAQP